MRQRYAGMANTRINHEKIIIPGTYGDKEIYLYHCIPEKANGVDIVLLHGVHSSAGLSARNKFNNLAELLLIKGFTPWLVETSRNARHRREGEETNEWAHRAFAGKTFAQEQKDVFLAIKEVLSRITAKAVWLWGFSLGGIIAAAAAGLLPASNREAPLVEKLILSGTGLQAYPEVENQMMKMPVLSTLRKTLSADMLSLVHTKAVISFRGEFDEVFSEESCRDFVDGIELPADKKTFLTIRGADHSLRLRNGKADCSILKEMVEYIA